MNTDYRVLVHTPAELSGEYIAWAEHIRSDSGVPFGVPAIDKHVIPMRAGDLVSIIARPGMGKTSLMAYLAREHAQRIMTMATRMLRLWCTSPGSRAQRS